MPLVDQRYDLDALLEAISPRTKLVYICHPEQPDGHDEHGGRARRLLRARARARADGRRSGVLRVHRPRRLPRRGRAIPAVGRACCGSADVFEDLRARRAPRSATRSPLRTSAVRWRRCGGRSTSSRRRRLRLSRASATVDELARRRAVNAEGLVRLDAVLRGTRARPGPVRRELPLRRDRRRGDRAVTTDCCSEGIDRAAPCRLRCAVCDAHHGRHPGRDRRARRALEPRARAPRELRRPRGSATPSAPRGAARRRVPAALRRRPHLGGRDVARAARTPDRGLRPHALRLVGRRALLAAKSCRRSPSGSCSGRSSTGCPGRG